MKLTFRYSGSSFKKKLMIFLIALIPVISGCDRGPSYAERTKACPALAVRDGYVAVKMKINKGSQEILLKLPKDDARISRGSAYYGNCDYADWFGLEYLWHNGKLIPEWSNRFKVPAKKRISVRLTVERAFLANDIQIRESWRFTPAVLHKRFPLEYYPRYLFSDPEKPSEQSISRSKLDHVWGIRSTRYTGADGNPFTAYCAIPPADPFRPNSRAEGVFANYSDSKCRGTVSAIKNGKGLSALIDVWAVGAPEINQIYDAAYEELQNFNQG